MAVFLEVRANDEAIGEWEKLFQIFRCYAGAKINWQPCSLLYGSNVGQFWWIAGEASGHDHGIPSHELDGVRSFSRSACFSIWARPRAPAGVPGKAPTWIIAMMALVVGVRILSLDELERGH